MKNIKVLGDGFIGSHLPYDKIKDRFAFDKAYIGSILSRYGNPDVIINTIGYCGVPNIDECEIRKQKTYETNTIFPIMLAEWAQKHNAQLIQIGSGCIFNGPSPHLQIISDQNDHISKIDTGWWETDFANPQSFYSRTKYAADLIIEGLGATILRIRMPISGKFTPRNFISKVRGYKQVIDIPNSMTMVEDLVRCIDWVIEKEKCGIYNVVNSEPITAAQVMREYQKYKPEHKFNIINETQLDKITVAKRSNTLLDGRKLRDEGFNMTPSKEALEICMKQYIKEMENYV